MYVREAASPWSRWMVALFALALASACAPSRAAQPAGPRKVTLWTFAKYNSEEWRRRKAEVDARFGIDLRVRVVPQDDFVERLRAAMEDGEGAPDVIEWVIEANRVLSADPERSLMLPLDPYVEKSESFREVVPARTAWVTYGGHVYGLPHDVYPVVLVYNDTCWKSVGVDVAGLETWDEFFRAARKLSGGGDGQPTRFALPAGNRGLTDTMYMIWQQTGAEILDPDGRPRFTSKEFTEYVEHWLRWYRTGVFAPWDWAGFRAPLADGTLCSYVSPDWWVPQVDEVVRRSSGEWRVRTLPAYRKGGPISASWGGSFMGIPKTTRDPQLVYAVIEHLQYDTASLERRWSETSMLTPRADLWSDPAFDRSDPRFGGQKFGQVLVAAGRGLPAMRTGDVFWDVLRDFEERFPDLSSGDSVEETLREIQEAAMARYERASR